MLENTNLKKSVLEKEEILVRQRSEWEEKVENAGHGRSVLETKLGQITKDLAQTKVENE